MFSKLKNPISLMLLFLLLGIVYFIIFTANTIRRNDSTFQLVNHTYRVIEKISNINSHIFNYESQVRGFVISNNKLFLSRLDSTETLLKHNINEVKQLTNDNKVQQQYLQLIDPLIKEKIAFQNRVLTTNEQSNSLALELIAGLQGKVLSDSVVHLLKLMQAEENRLLNIRIKENKSISKERFHASLIVAIIAFLLLTFALLKIEKEHMLRKKTEDEIRAKQEESQKLLQSILDHIPMVVYMKDLNGKQLMANRQFYNLFNEAGYLSFEQAESMMHTDEAAALKYSETDNKVKETLQPLELECVFNTSNGKRDMYFVKFPLLDKNNQLFAICTIGRDISELARYQRQLYAAKVKAEKAELLQEEFLANMSHEIRTPMNGIIGMTNLMETTELNEEQKEYIDLIKKSSHILLNLINDILDLSKIKAGKMTIDPIHFNLAETINRVVAPLEYRAKEKGVQIIKQIENVSVYLEGDQKKLEQILNNLIGNAVKFTDKGKITLHVTTIEEKGNEHRLQFSVSDTGIGIAQEDIEYIFESFTQASDNMVKKAGGTGLGLAITKKLVEIQGGKIEASSEFGSGSVFCFELPYKVSSGQKQPKIYLQDQLSKKQQEFVKGKRVLLVEDNIVNQKVSCKLLEKAGLEVDLANDGKHAIDILMNGNTYDLIIMDLRMPMMDGYQTTIYIRNKLLLQTPIIAMTASVLRNERAKCLEIGMNDYITKPFAPDTLFHKMYILLNPGAATQEEEGLEPIISANGFYNLSLIEEMEDDEYTLEILGAFLDTTPVALEEIRTAIMHADYPEIYNKVHKLKSSLGILQVNNMFQLMNEIEAIALKAGELSIIEEKFNIAVQQYALLQPMLEAEVEEVRT